MAQTLAQVRARLALLYTSYDELAALPIHSYSAPQRDAQTHKLDELLKQIAYWEAREAALDTSVSTEENEGGISYAQFEPPA